MRDIAITLFVFGMIPVILRSPWIGILMWAWVSVMSPHSFAWGFARSLPVSMVTGFATLAGMLFTRDRVRLPVNSTTILLALLPLWMTVTLLFAFNPEDAFSRWKSVMTVFAFVLVMAAVLNTRKHIEALIWVLVFSVGFFGFKGGIFTIATGGSYKVYGPPGYSFISDNNAISVALVMIIPLTTYLAQQTKQRALKFLLYATVGLSLIAVLGSQSRGAFLALAVMSLFLWLKSRNKVLLGAFVLGGLAVAVVSMPSTWKNRMQSVQTYQQDASAMGRINAWHNAINVANDRPLVGGGFELYTPEVFARYAPDPQDVHAAHSVYFQMLGEHGYVGLLLFLSVFVVGWRNARRVIRLASRNRDLAWASDLARAIQVSLIGFAVGGAFVNIGYWELEYYELVVLMVVWNLVRISVSNSAVENGAILTKQADRVRA